MHTHGHGDFQFGSHAVGAGNQDGLFPFFSVESEEAAESADAPRTPGVKVRLAWWRILCFASSATAMSTPASAYFMKTLSAIRIRYEL